MMTTMMQKTRARIKELAVTIVVVWLLVLAAGVVSFFIVLIANIAVNSI